jgi:type VI secretion system protein ImpJ
MAQKPHWPVDLVLTTHVFQFQDRYHEDLVAERFEAMFSYSWGVSELEWDLPSLGAGELSLRRLRAILPDGTPVAVDARDAETCPPLSVRDIAPDGSLVVYLATPRTGSRSSGADSITSRYVKERTLVPDYANGSAPAELEWLRPRLSLLREGERLDAYTVLQCARVVRSAAGALSLDLSFVPPVLSVGASTFLDLELRRALDALASQRLALRRLPSRDGGDGVRKWLISLMSGFVPRLADVIEQRAHPHDAYLVLSEIVGALASFTQQGDAPIPPFDFVHLGPVFANLFAAFHGILEALGAEQYRKIALRVSDAVTLYAELKEPGIFRKDFYLSVLGDDPERLRIEAPAKFKIASWSDLARVISTHSKGVTLRLEHVPPPSLPDVPGAVYFLLEKSEAFTPIYKTGELGIHHGGLPGVREIALYVVDAPGSMTR